MELKDEKKWNKRMSKIEHKDELFWKALKLILQLPLLIETSNHKINIIRTGKLTLLDILSLICIYDARTLPLNYNDKLNICHHVHPHCNSEQRLPWKKNPSR